MYHIHLTFIHPCTIKLYISREGMLNYTRYLHFLDMQVTITGQDSGNRNSRYELRYNIVKFSLYMRSK